MTAKQVGTYINSALPWITAFVLMLFSVIGYFVLQEFATVKNLERTVYELGTDTAVMKSNRFTSSDGLAVWREIQNIHIKIAELNARIPEEVPPEWFQDRVSAISRDVDNNGKKIELVLERLSANAVLINSLKAKMDSYSNGSGV